MPAPGSAPIFYDPRQRRRPLVVTLSLLLSLAGTIFCISLVLLPLLPKVYVPKPQFASDIDLTNPAIVNRNMSARRFLLNRDKEKLSRLIRRERRARAMRRAALAAVTGRAGAPFQRPVVAAFYVDWDETSLASLNVHADELTHLMPEWLHLNTDARSFSTELKGKQFQANDPAWAALKLARRHGLSVVPLINNYLNGVWRGDLLHDLLTHPGKQTALIAQIRSFLLANRLQGINIDFEEAGQDDGDALTVFMGALHDSLAPAGLLVTQDVPVDDDTYQLPQLAQVTDFLMPMLYDLHYSQSAPGPIAPQAWFEDRLNQLCAQVPPSKLVLSLGNYAYDWQKGRTAESQTFQEAIVTAREAQEAAGDSPDDPSGKIDTDAASLNPKFTYYDDAGQPHQVWMLDAVTAFNEWRYARQKQPLGVGLWYLGAEDPSLWSFFGRGHLLAAPNPEPLSRIQYGFQVDFEGEGEILSVRGIPQEGRRALEQGSRGFIAAERWQQFPSSYVIRRWGREHHTGQVALTFDDGPSGEFTPQILDILKQEGVHGTFFLIGRNAEEYAGLTRRIWDEGNEIGNHTFNHPNLSETSPRRTELELNATERAIESIIGYSTPLFRPPYEADAEPSTADQVLPIWRANQLGYVMIGESIDPHDWDTTHHVTARQIVERVLADRNEGNCILLHDGGGDRTATVAALPEIIHTLKALHYQFVTVSQLMGKPRAAVFKPVTGSERLLVGADRFIFDTAFGVDRTLRILFVLAIVLGLGRVAAMSVLAIIQFRRTRRRELGRPWDPASGCGPSYCPRVSVVIAAFNEAKVIRRTIETVLGGVYKDLEVVVVDDGSTDGTAEVARAAFHDDPRVRVVTKENGGKASALNRGLELAEGEVIVALDADTLFDRWTIARLVRHFADPLVGAVAGNVKVGNATNLLTRWQAIEYITSQNFDRRAHDLLNCITVVPGAVGAWRREAIEQAGGYSSQTLAEDTDLTWTIRKLGYRIVTENEALAYTEAPDGLRALARQRFRWAFGTLQNLWKHRGALLNPRYGAFGLLALPSLWLYQITFQAVAPAVDLTILSSLWMGDVQRILFYYAVFFVAELAGGLVAFSLERENKRLLIWLFWQRFIYRQLMYYVIVRSILRAIGGSATGWGKLERKGTSRVQGSISDANPPVPQESLV
jgi:cellulose synthase/poly-beta-1,6-N-acetylglucosamine synthase-like glycosyltransferase/peptidoglycan/xylan/chitin deacetylase (PgdA/CDA1 family)/spore germination protein YaaH